MKTVEERLASIETTLGFHGRAHEAIDNKVQVIDSKLDTLLLNQAEKSGESKTTKKIAAIVSGAISLGVTLVVAYFQS